MQRFSICSWVVAIGLLASCTGQIDGVGDDDDGSGDGSQAPTVCEQARAYTGLGGDDMTVDRPKIAVGTDRMRMKPYAALAAEYNRALGLTDVNTAPYAGTFGKSPPRWYEEPAASAATVYAAFALAYSACSRKTAAGGTFAMAPGPALADQICRDFTRAAWRRDATADEISACSTFALTQTKASDPPAKRWAYTCASVLTASDFLSY
jgi:hypothetical protein